MLTLRFLLLSLLPLAFTTPICVRLDSAHRLPDIRDCYNVIHKIMDLERRHPGTHHWSSNPTPSDIALPTSWTSESAYGPARCSVSVTLVAPAIADDFPYVEVVAKAFAILGVCAIEQGKIGYDAVWPTSRARVSLYGLAPGVEANLTAIGNF